MKPNAGRKAKTAKIRLSPSKLLRLGGESDLGNRRMVGGKMINLRPPVAKK